MTPNQERALRFVRRLARRRCEADPRSRGPLRSFCIDGPPGCDPCEARWALGGPRR